MSDTTELTLHVDPACPWAWLTSRWLAEVERVRPVHVTTRLFSLAEVNRGHEADAGHERSHSAGETAMRVLVAARRSAGDAALARLYTEIGEAYQERDEPLGDESTLRRCCEAAGLDPALVDEALSDPTTYQEVLADHRDAVARGGFGVPTIYTGDDQGLFGPIVDVRLTGEAAGELWDRVAWLLSAPHFFELKRERTEKAGVGRYRGR